MELTVHNARDRADRESLSTVLAQQRLIAVLNEALGECNAQSGVMAKEMSELRNKCELQTCEVKKWKRLAMLVLTARR